MQADGGGIGKPAVIKHVILDSGSVQPTAQHSGINIRVIYFTGLLIIHPAILNLTRGQICAPLSTSYHYCIYFLTRLDMTYTLHSTLSTCLSPHSVSRSLPCTLVSTFCTHRLLWSQGAKTDYWIAINCDLCFLLTCTSYLPSIISSLLPLLVYCYVPVCPNTVITLHISLHVNVV